MRPVVSRALAAWLLWCADRIESIAYWFDDRAWARPTFGEHHVAVLDTEPLAERIARLEGRPPAPLPYDPDGYDVYGQHWRDKL